MKWNWMLLPVALAATFACHADEGGSPPKCSLLPTSADTNPFVDLIDPAAPADRRAAVLEGFQRASALPHCTEQMYTLGQLYRHGPELPGNLLPQDTARARELLLGSAEDGYMSAYADLAEMALAEGDAREAMKWTQVYLYFVKNVEKIYMNKESVQFYSAGYNGDLLLRAERAWRKARPRLDRALINKDLSGYVTHYRDEVATRIHSRIRKRKTREEPASAPPGELRGKLVGTCKPSGMKGINAARVVYLVEVLPSGEIHRAVAESFAGDPAVVEKLAHCARIHEYQPFNGQTTRVARIPVWYGYPRSDFTPSFKL